MLRLTVTHDNVENETGEADKAVCGWKSANLAPAIYTDGRARNVVGMSAPVPGAGTMLMLELAELALIGAAARSLRTPMSARLHAREPWDPGIEANVPLATSVGNTRERAEDVFRRPVRLPWREPTVCRMAQESYCFVDPTSTGVGSNDTTRPRPTTCGAVSSWLTMSRGK